MSKILVLAEKPSVARDIAKVLNCNNKGNGFLEGKSHIVTWALGHLVTLAEPEAYDDKYKTWNLEDLPMLPAQLKLIVIRQTSKQYHAVKAQMNRKDVSEIVIATDAGREGELVARWIIEKAHINKPIKRLWISSVTDKAIKDGFNKLKNGKEYENLYAAAVARAQADWLVGINATRALTCKFNAQLSCGRVQTPTLAIIAKREEEIKNFRPKTFYGITAVTDSLKFTWQDDKTKDTRTFSKEKGDTILATIKKQNNREAKIVEVNKTYKKTSPPQLYNLTEIQREANNFFGYSAKETLSILQKLYEQHKVLTYPRTDSRYLSTDMVATLKERIRACGVQPWAKSAMKILNKPMGANKAFVDNSKVTDHHAIIPTEQSIILSSLSNKELKIYSLVVKRFLAALFPPFEYEQTTIKANVAGETFIARGKIVISSGWKEVYEDNFQDHDEQEDIADQLLPSINEGDTLKITDVFQTQGETKPPSPFNEGTLLAAMENPTKYMETGDKGLIKTIGQTGGLGTVATRADIIEKLYNSFLMEKRGKEIFLTSKGRQLLELVPHDLKSPVLTAQWEQQLAAIERGSLKKNNFVNNMREYAKTVVNEIKNSEEKFTHDNITGNRCPQCGKYMLEVAGKKGKILICQDRDCGHRKNIAKVTNARCPECRKKLELRGEGEGQIFVCPCGYREKMSSFKKRRADNTKVSKRDVHRYLKEQTREQDKPLNTALADALAKLKI